MNSSNGLGQPSADQPDFDGPQGDRSQPGSGTSAGWGPTGGQYGVPPSQDDPVRPGGTPSFGSAPTPSIGDGGHQGGYPPGQASNGAPGWTTAGQQPNYPQGSPNYPQSSSNPQAYPQGQGYPQSQTYPPTQSYPQGQSYPPTQSYPQGQQSYPNTAFQPPAPGYGPPGQQSYGQQVYGQGTQPFGQGGYTPPVQAPPTRPPGSGGRGLILAGVVIALLIVGLLGWQFFGPKQSQQPSTSPSPAASAPVSPAATPQPTVSRVTQSPRPTASVPVTGGGLGQAVDFKTQGGSGKVTVTKATWADNGLIDPTEGEQYLIVDVTLEGVSGKVTTGPFFASVVDAAGDNHMLSIGADLDNQLAMRTLGPGQRNTGQIAFELERGAVTFQVLDELLTPVATVQIPG